MFRFKSSIAAAIVVALSACAAPHAALVPTQPQGATPAEVSGSMPGDDALCSLNTVLSGQAACAIALNANLPPISDPTEPASLIPGLHPADLQSAYALPAQNSGKRVAVVVAYDDPTAESDLNVYRTAFGLPACTSSNGCFTKITQSGSASPLPAANAAWAQEAALDLEMVSAACPNCRITLVEANSNGLRDLGSAVNTAVATGAVAVSNSYYAAEWPGETAIDASYHHSGVAMTASSGDNTGAVYPAASPYVTAVGGTSLTGSAGAWKQTAWTYGGHGCSAYEKRPAWQNGTGCKTRAAVDMAAVGDPQTGVAMYDTTGGGWLVAGGTSAGAPLIAAAYALSGNPRGPGYSYSHRSGFTDIAPAGYDQPTGLGAPRGLSGL